LPLPIKPTSKIIFSFFIFVNLYFKYNCHNINSFYFINIFLKENFMRRKKKPFLWYVLVVVLAAAALWIISRDVPLNQQQVEQQLENTFAK